MLPRGDGVRVTLSDGSSFDVSHELHYELSLESGHSLSAEEAGRLRFAASLREAQERALALLARSQHTRKELGQKLERRGYPAEVVSLVIARLDELRYLDDARAAGLWVEHRLERHPEGRAALLAGLLRHGVPRETAVEAVDARLPPSEEVVVARRVLARLYSTAAALEALRGEPGRSRALARLATRGFSRASSRAALPARAPNGEREDDRGEEEG